MDFANMDRRQLTLAGAGFSVMLTLHYSFQLVSQHLFYWKNPKEQRSILIILLLPPVYAVTSFFGFIDRRGSKQFFMLLDSVKDCYSALAIATFLSLIYSYSNLSMSRDSVPDEMKGREIRLLFPMNLLLPRTTRLNQEKFRRLKSWIWQFVIIRPVCSVLMMALQFIGVYPSWLGWGFTVVLNISILLAMYSLLVFYYAFAKELEPHEPLSKFICIKGIVFFGFWQGVLLHILVDLGVLQSHHFWLETENVGEAYHKVLVCVEMMFFAVLHQYAYHAAPYSGDVEAKLKLQKKHE
ncbi:hypothetical protein SASPL_144557 [Salvia splendens]|uniref:Uncharacterized protein n=1 Tax=Salvia splendens TaxID=180675 RepID=A0A8X8WFZ1_SALSN|nr:transmembrane protein 184C-like [Salvia splendens]KAG6393981.1 hypothetical protein SASPL_144557 [Salvia splendens]